jgi:hypothetical protein
MPSYLPPSAVPSPHGSSAALCVPTSSGESVSSRPQKRQRVQSSSSSVAGNPGQPHEYAARAFLQQQHQQQQQQQQQQSAALKNGVTTAAVGGGGAGPAAQKFSNANGYMGTGGQKTTGGGSVAGGNVAKQHQNYMRSPSSSHASLHSTPVSVVGGGSTSAAMVGRNSVPTPMAPTPSPSNGDVKPLLPIEEGPATIRVREEGGTETFALPLAMVNSWEVC